MTIEITLLIAIGSFVIGFLGHRRKEKADTESEAKEKAITNTKLDHIDNGVQDIRAEVRSTGKRLDEVNARVIRVEESTRSAHKRLDRVEGK